MFAQPRTSMNPSSKSEYLQPFLPFQNHPEPPTEGFQSWNGENTYRGMSVYPQGLPLYPYVPQPQHSDPLQYSYSGAEAVSPKSAKMHYALDHGQPGPYHGHGNVHDNMMWKRGLNGYGEGHDSKIGKALPSKSRKRFRRKFSEIDRIFRCTHHGCDKAYGKLNHLNTHIISQNHGEKKTTEEYRELLRLVRGSRDARGDHDSDHLERHPLDQHDQLKHSSLNYTTGLGASQGYPSGAVEGYGGYYGSLSGPNSSAMIAPLSNVGTSYIAPGYGSYPQPAYSYASHGFLPYGYPPHREEKVNILNEDKVRESN